MQPTSHHPVSERLFRFVLFTLLNEIVSSYTKVRTKNICAIFAFCYGYNNRTETNNKNQQATSQPTNNQPVYYKMPIITNNYI